MFDSEDAEELNDLLYVIKQDDKNTDWGNSARCALCDLIGGGFSSCCDHCTLGDRGDNVDEDGVAEETNCFSIAEMSMGLL